MFNKKVFEPNETLEKVLNELKGQVKDNLYSVILYGGLVDGKFNSKTSDINLLITLRDSNPEVHRVLAKIITPKTRIEPMIFSLRGLDRGLGVFAKKFIAIKRQYKVLFGEDILKNFTASDELDRFLVEQSLRNILLRLTNRYLLYDHNPKQYCRLVVNHIFSGLLVDFSETLRLAGKTVPDEFSEKIKYFENEFDIPMQVLNDLYQYKQKPYPLDDANIFRIHSQLFTITKHVVFWFENHWPKSSIQVEL